MFVLARTERDAAFRPDKHSTSPLSPSMAVISIVELSIEPKPSLTMVTVNGGHEGIGNPWPIKQLTSPGSLHWVRAPEVMLWVQVIEMRSPGHAVNIPLVDSGVDVKLPIASADDHRFLNNKLHNWHTIIMIELEPYNNSMLSYYSIGFVQWLIAYQ